MGGPSLAPGLSTRIRCFGVAASQLSRLAENSRKTTFAHNLPKYSQRHRAIVRIYTSKGPNFIESNG